MASRRRRCRPAACSMTASVALSLPSMARSLAERTLVRFVDACAAVKDDEDAREKKRAKTNTTSWWSTLPSVGTLSFSRFPFDAKANPVDHRNEKEKRPIETNRTTETRGNGSVSRRGFSSDARRRGPSFDRYPPRHRVDGRRSIVLCTVEDLALWNRGSSSRDGPFSDSSVRGPFTWVETGSPWTEQGVGMLPTQGVSGCHPMRTERGSSARRGPGEGVTASWVGVEMGGCLPQRGSRTKQRLVASHARRSGSQRRNVDPRGDLQRGRGLETGERHEHARSTFVALAKQRLTRPP